MYSKNVVCAALLSAALLATPAAAQEQLAPVPDELKAVIQDTISATEVKLFRPGPLEADWSKGGVDLKSAIAGKPGGLTGNYLLSIDDEGRPSIWIYSSAPVTSFVPSSWKRIARIGDPDAGGPESVLAFGGLEGPYYVVTRGTEKRVGDASCASAPIGADLYKAPGGRNSEVEMPLEVAKLAFEALIAMGSKYSVCEKFEAAVDGYTVRYFFEDGRSLPGMDEGKERISIVPAQPVAELLKTKG